MSAWGFNPSRRLAGRCAVAALAFTAALAGCTGVEGDYDGVPYNPRGVELAVADRHDIITVGGRLVATRRPEGQVTLSLLFSAARAGASDEWRRYDAQAFTELQTALAVRDGLLIEKIDPVTAVAGTLRASRQGGTMSGDFRFAAPAGDSAYVEQVLGDDVDVALTFDTVGDRRDADISGVIEVERAASAAQDDAGIDAAEGTVRFPFALRLAAERQAKANLAVARPILECAMQVGPGRSGACAQRAAGDVPDASAF